VLSARHSGSIGIIKTILPSPDPHPIYVTLAFAGERWFEFKTSDLERVKEEQEERKEERPWKFSGEKEINTFKHVISDFSNGYLYIESKVIDDNGDRRINQSICFASDKSTTSITIPSRIDVGKLRDALEKLEDLYWELGLK
jgi:hypothetical protein